MTATGFHARRRRCRHQPRCRQHVEKRGLAAAGLFQARDDGKSFVQSFGIALQTDMPIHRSPKDMRRRGQGEGDRRRRLAMRGSSQDRASDIVSDTGAKNQSF